MITFGISQLRKPNFRKSKKGITYLPVFASCFAFLAAFFFFKDGIKPYCAYEAKKTFLLFVSILALTIVAGLDQMLFEYFFSPFSFPTGPTSLN